MASQVEYITPATPPTPSAVRIFAATIFSAATPIGPDVFQVGEGPDALRIVDELENVGANQDAEGYVTEKDRQLEQPGGQASCGGSSKNYDKVGK